MDAIDEEEVLEREEALQSAREAALKRVADRTRLEKVKKLEQELAALEKKERQESVDVTNARVEAAKRIAEKTKLDSEKKSELELREEQKKINKEKVKIMKRPSFAKFLISYQCKSFLVLASEKSASVDNEG